MKVDRNLPDRYSKFSQQSPPQLAQFSQQYGVGSLRYAMPIEKSVDSDEPN
jgi:hypothetical protein